ncbi:MAG: acyltransferase [Lachnospiraceae bacterium]|uniref:acyltransferase family protein n=1 Tax=Candidatus Merdisoma sp. JLR.KK011 TaxID=3114299 RepID=UPI002FEF6568|nr:acyltransferase [Lachnospiraceae bacterium]
METTNEGQVFYKKALVNPVKAIAIILMFMLHLLNTEWLAEPSMLLDFQIGGVLISKAVSDTCEFCIGIFAFTTGYGWNYGFGKKNIFRRIAEIYLSYFLVLFLFNIPTGILFHEFDIQSLTTLKGIMILLSISSEGSRFCWYIYFYVLAVLTFPFLNKLIKKAKKNSIITIGLILLSFILLRTGTRICYGLGMFDRRVLSIIVHYLTWMPVILLGAYICDKSIFEFIDKKIRHIFGDSIAFPVILLSSITLVKIFIQRYLGIYSNFDSVFIIPYMYAVIRIAAVLIQSEKCRKGINIIGSCSLYLWLTHSFLLYESIQPLLYVFRLPMFIIMAAIFFMMPISWILFIFDKNLKTWIF